MIEAGHPGAPDGSSHYAAGKLLGFLWFHIGIKHPDFEGMVKGTSLTHQTIYIYMIYSSVEFRLGEAANCRNPTSSPLASLKFRRTLKYFEYKSQVQRTAQPKTFG